MSRVLAMFLSLSFVGVADAALPDPVGRIRATTEIHGVPPIGAAHVENKIFVDYPFDGTVVTLIDDNIEVDDPPPSNTVQFVGSFTSVDEFTQTIEFSFFGPNAIDDDPADDQPIFVDLFGTYTDSDNPAGVLTGPVDMFDISAFILWTGIDASDLVVSPETVRATVVNVDGRVTELGFSDHPFHVARVLEQDGETLWIGLYSSVFGNPPFLPELLENADEVHIRFDVSIPEPSSLILLVVYMMLPHPYRMRREHC